jgi:hypothetical protein
MTDMLTRTASAELEQLPDDQLPNDQIPEVSEPLPDGRAEVKRAKRTWGSAFTVRLRRGRRREQRPSRLYLTGQRTPRHYPPRHNGLEDSRMRRELYRL